MAKIHIMVSRHSAFYSPLIAAITAGFLKREGLEPTYAIAKNFQSVPDGIRAGTVHVGQSAVSVSWGPMERGETSPMVHFAQINERDGFFITAREPDPDFVWNKLVGKQVLADHGEQPLAMFKYALHKMNVDVSQLDIIDAGGVEAMDQAFRAGQGDYVHQQGPAPQQLEKDGIGHVVASVGKAIGPVAFSSLCASPEWLSSDMAKAFMRAYRQARRYVITTPAADIASSEADFFKGIDHDVLSSTIEFYQGLGCWTPEVRITRETYNTALDVFQHSSVITQRHPYEAVVVPPPDDG